MGLNKTLLASIIASMGKFSPLSLFSGAIQGAWYDANDLSTLWQDTSGTVPAVVNAKVARINDKSGNNNHVTQATAGAQAYLRGTPTGLNLVTDPFFYSGASWTAGTGWTVAKPVAVAVSASASLDYSLPAVSGSWYLVKYTVQTRTAGSVVATFGGVTLDTVSATGTYFKCVLATSTASFSMTASGFSGTVRGIEIYDISAGLVQAPYYLEFDGATTFYACANMLSAYPSTMASQFLEYPGAGVHALFATHQSDTDVKLLDTGRGLDWKEATVSSYTGGSYNSAVQASIADFASGSNISESNLIAGSAATHSNTWGTKTTFFLGKGWSSAFYMLGRFYGGLVVAKTLSSPERIGVRAYYNSDNFIQAWGDSMTAGSGVGVTTGWPVRLGNALNIYVENQGAGGQTSAQITTRFVADTSSKDQWINTLWMGTNDPYSGDQAAWVATIQANLSTCVSGLKGLKRYLVLGVTRLDGGSTPAAALDALDSQLLITYGNRFVDVRGYLQALNDGSVNDLADIDLGLVPRSLRSDAIHLNDTGYQHVADLLALKIKSLGWS